MAVKKNSKPNSASRTEAYRKAALIMAVAGGGALVSVWLLYVFRFPQLSGKPEDWGVFGDYFAGVAGTIVALITLVAIAYTIRLQATELAETSKALREQVTNAQKFEDRKIQPIIKTEWHLSDTIVEWRLTNIGFGPAYIENAALSELPDVFPVPMDDSTEAHDFWREKVSALDAEEYVRDYVIPPPTTSRRFLSAGEAQMIVRYHTNSPHQAYRMLQMLEMKYSAAVTFRSLTGQRFTLDSQESLFRPVRPGVFEVYKDRAGEYRFRLVSSEGVKLLASEGFSTLEECRSTIETMKKVAPHKDKYEKKQSEAGEHYFVIKAGNHQIIGVSTMYDSPVEMESGIAAVIRNSTSELSE